MVAAYRELLGQGHAPESIACAGAFAGGGLTIMGALAARDAGLPMPAAIVAFSPGVDATRAGESMVTKAGEALDRAALFLRQHVSGWPGTACRARARHVLSKWKVHDGGASMRDSARDPAALEPLERLRAQRRRLADRMRPPWWYLTGGAVLWALAFAGPFSPRYLPQGVPIWPFLVAAVAVACLLQWGLARATGISVGIPDLTYRPGRPARIAMLVVSLAAIVTEHFLIDRGLLVAAVVVAALAVVAGVVSVQAALRGIRQDLRAGGGAA